MITLVYVTWHLWEFRVQKLLGAYGPYLGGGSMSGLPSHAIVSAAMSNNLTAAVTAAGVVASAYHLCNGVWTFLITWGITIGPRSQRFALWITNTAFVAVSALGLASITGFR